MDELIQLIFFGAIILIGILGRKKKKSPPAPRPTRPQPTVRTEPSVPAEARPLPPRREAAEAQSALVRSAQERPVQKRGIAEELLEMLQQRLEVPDEPPAPVERVPVERVPETLETLEPAGGASHERFHERYVDQEPAERPYQQHEERAQRLELSRKKLQQAFIMKEIIGRPKGIE